MRRRLAVFLTAALVGFSGPVLALDEPDHGAAAASAVSPDVAPADQAEDPRVGYFVSETGEFGFVLDRTGEKGLLRFDQSVEILILDMVPGPQGVTYLNDRLGTTILRLMPWGGATVYDADGTEGAAFGLKALVKPLTLQLRNGSYVRSRAGEISRALAARPGLDVTFNFERSRVAARTRAMKAEGPSLAITSDEAVSSLVSGDTVDRSPSGGTLDDALENDALEVTGLALTRLARDELALEVMSERIERVTIRAGAQSGLSLKGKALIVTYVPERGLYGRPSSAEIERFLLDNL